MVPEYPLALRYRRTIAMKTQKITTTAAIVICPLRAAGAPTAALAFMSWLGSDIGDEFTKLMELGLGFEMLRFGGV